MAGVSSSSGNKLSTKNNAEAFNDPSENTSLTGNNNKSSNTTAEIEKWKKFGYLMAESYDELKKENEKVKQEREKDRKIVLALKDQVDKLKLIIKAKSMDGNMDENERHRSNVEKDKEIERLRQELIERDRKVEEMRRELE